MYHGFKKKRQIANLNPVANITKNSLEISIIFFGAESTSLVYFLRLIVFPIHSVEKYKFVNANLFLLEV
jgi:hypothetical protein